MLHARRRIGQVALAATTLLALAGASDASAAQLYVQSGVLHYDATPGQPNRVSVFRVDDSGHVDVFQSDNDAVAVGEHCSAGDYGNYRCEGVTSVVLNLGDRDDSGYVDVNVDATLSGGNGNDALTGGNGADQIIGGAGDDSLDGGAGADRVSGAAGNDTLLNLYTRYLNVPDGTAVRPSDTGDVLDGGDGYDRLFAYATQRDYLADPQSTPLPVNVTLDDQANDGASGEGDNVRNTVESAVIIPDQNTFTSATGEGPGSNDTLTGNAGANDLAGGPADDTIDGGNGNDVLSGNAGNDTLRAQDGFADVVTCGDGADTATVDTVDSVDPDCETVDRKQVAGAGDDAPPTVELAAAKLSSSSPTTLSAEVGDDRGVSQVVFMANARVVCTVTAAPYTCQYQPKGADVGRVALRAIAIDASQQTTTAARFATLGRFKARLGVSVGDDLDVSGKLTRPAGVTVKQGCRGTVSVSFVSAGGRTLATRRSAVSDSCGYAVAGGSDASAAATVVVRFLGNKVLRPAKRTVDAP